MVSPQIWKVWKKTQEIVLIERLYDATSLQVNLYDARKRQSKNLSGGMRHRLSVAMACIGNPDILILDEPTTGLDPVSRRQVGVAIFAAYQSSIRLFRCEVYFFTSSSFCVGLGGDWEG